jgi:hypothetical protein
LSAAASPRGASLQVAVTPPLEGSVLASQGTVRALPSGEVAAHGSSDRLATTDGAPALDPGPEQGTGPGQPLRQMRPVKPAQPTLVETPNGLGAASEASEASAGE